MLGFLAPGEKAAVTGASMISLQVKSEEAKFYFVEQALEEAKHFDALRRLVGKITGKPLGEPSAAIRLLYSFGVIDPDDVAFMMGSINVIGEHLANQIFHQINHVAKDETVRKVLALIGKDESRHIAAGQRFFPEVYADLRRNRHRIMAKNLATTMVLLFAGYELVNPMRKLDIDLSKILEAMYQHYEEVTDGLPAFPEQGVFDVLLSLLRKSTPGAVAVVHKVTGDGGQLDARRLIHLCETALKSPRHLRDLFAA
jgi:rubrerythrin